MDTVAPGATRAPINAGSDDIATMTAGTAGTPGGPEEVAAAVAWLASSSAGHIRGATIPVDGGITATRPM